MEMTKKEYVQRYVLSLGLDDSWQDEDILEQIDQAVRQYDLIEKSFEVTPTKDLWDYNDRN